MTSWSSFLAATRRSFFDLSRIYNTQLWASVTSMSSQTAPLSSGPYRLNGRYRFTKNHKTKLELTDFSIRRQANHTVTILESQPHSRQQTQSAAMKS